MLIVNLSTYILRYKLEFCQDLQFKILLRSNIRKKSAHIFHILWKKNNRSLSYICECDFGLNLERFACVLLVHAFTSVILNGLYKQNGPIKFWAKALLGTKIHLGLSYTWAENVRINAGVMIFNLLSFISLTPHLHL